MPGLLGSQPPKRRSTCTQRRSRRVCGNRDCSSHALYSISAQLVALREEETARERTLADGLPNEVFPQKLETLAASLPPTRVVLLLSSEGLPPALGSIICKLPAENKRLPWHGADASDMHACTKRSTAPLTRKGAPDIGFRMTGVSNDRCARLLELITTRDPVVTLTPYASPPGFRSPPLRLHVSHGVPRIRTRPDYPPIKNRAGTSVHEGYRIGHQLCFGRIPCSGEFAFLFSLIFSSVIV